MTDSDMGLNVMLEGTQRDTPRMRALFGLGCSNSVSPVSEVVEAQTGWPIEDPEGARSPGVDLADAVACLQKEVEDFRSECGYVCSEKSVIPPQPSSWAWCTSTTVPIFAGKTSWDQHRQVVEAIVSSNEWDGVTAALQLLSHLEGDALNVALLVPAPRRVLPGGLVEALTEHYSSPGRLADYRRRFEKAFREPGSDPSVFVVELETLAMRAFGDLSPLARLQLVRDRFIAGQVGRALRRHLDSVEPETPIQDIVDRCRVWESHAEFVDNQGDSPTPRQPLAVYMIDDAGTGKGQAGATVNITPED